MLHFCLRGSSCLRVLCILKLNRDEKLVEIIAELNRFVRKIASVVVRSNMKIEMCKR